jgi:hypothetical protein
MDVSTTFCKAVMTIATYAAAIYALRTARGKYFLGPLFLGMKNNSTG